MVSLPQLVSTVGACPLYWVYISGARDVDPFELERYLPVGDIPLRRVVPGMTMLVEPGVLVWTNRLISLG